MKRVSILLLLLTLMTAVSCSSISSRKCARIISECMEIGTAEYTCDIRFRNQPAKYEEYKPGPRIILYSAKAYIKAGVRIQDESDVQIEKYNNGHSVTVTLPRPTILYYKMEPTDVKKEFEKVGFFRWDFTNDEKLSIRQRAEKELLQQVSGSDPRIPILQDAAENARTQVELLLKATGHFDYVNVDFR